MGKIQQISRFTKEPFCVESVPLQENVHDKSYPAVKLKQKASLLWNNCLYHIWSHCNYKVYECCQTCHISLVQAANGSSASIDIMIRIPVIYNIEYLT